MNLLWIDCCLRGPELSRTYHLCQCFLQEFATHHPQVQVTHRDLSCEALPVLTGPMTHERDVWVAQGINHPLLTYAREVAQADLILVGAPYWDLSFPAALKIYLEWASVRGITFGYESDGRQVGLSRAKALVYVTTGGGPVAEQNYGYDYIKALGKMFGIRTSHCVFAEGLDICGADKQVILAQAEVALGLLAAGL